MASDVAEAVPASGVDALARRRRHWEMLIVASVVLVLAFALEVRPDQRVAFRLAPHYPMPETCMSRYLFGVSCPGCGLTRSIVHLARGDWRHSLQLHHLGWLLAAAILFQFPYRLWCLWRDDCSRATRSLSRCFGTILIVLLIGNWLCELLLHRH
jgi:hypothetical protein